MAALIAWVVGLPEALRELAKTLHGVAFGGSLGGLVVLVTISTIRTRRALAFLAILGV